MSEKIVPRKVYVLVWATLVALTFGTWGIALIDLGPFNLVVALTIAVIKASLVALFFMHLLYTRRRTRLVLIAGLSWLIILMLTMGDYLTRRPLPLIGRGSVPVEAARYHSAAGPRSFTCAPVGGILISRASEGTKWTTLPPTTVISTRIFEMSSSGMVR
jgi:cytochrome c oxidase subunit 4